MAESRYAPRPTPDGRHDPRAPVKPTTNGVVPESCGFYSEVDEVTGCRKPRSCYDCLKRPGCVITKNGRCEHASELQQYNHTDYHFALNDEFPHGPAYNVTWLAPATHTFDASNATYCAASDRICAECRVQFETHANSSKYHHMHISTQFCVGEAGCVCVAACEVPRLYRFVARDRTCDFQFDAYDMIHSVILLDKPPVVSNRDHDPRVLRPVTRTHLSSGESCGFHDDVDIQGCRRRR